MNVSSGKGGGGCNGIYFKTVFNDLMSRKA